MLFRGYRATATDALLEEIAESFEDVWRERADLADKVEQLETDLVRYRELETLLRATLVSAEQASAQTRDQARREAELILTEAHAEAREIQRRAIAENERLEHESRRLRVQLQEALSALGRARAGLGARAGGNCRRGRRGDRGAQLVRPARRERCLDGGPRKLSA